MVPAGPVIGTELGFESERGGGKSPHEGHTIKPELLDLPEEALPTG